ncbi:MAG: ribonuclease III [Lachnospiraceae bacterium]|nr:ribonuclease III [Lachnospiraceae bacterium]
MEESVAGTGGTEKGSDGFFEEIREYYKMQDVDLRTYSPLTLAFIGDGVYELVIRSLIVGRGNAKPGRLHAHTSHLVRAESQAELIEVILPELSEEEQDFYRRGKNAKPQTMAKNASPEAYHTATGFETLMGYLYLTGQTKRMLYLIGAGLDGIGAAETADFADHTDA